MGFVSCYWWRAWDGALIMRAVLLPLKNSIDNLNQMIRTLGDSTKDNTHRIDKLEEHIGEAKVRDQKITALEHEVFGRRIGRTNQ